ncbi:hypothetical protein B0H21DRAFT_821630 [Amylocystis lapponica]|nr:hypothetical protein B0H21DRAFT_821630 [Amylocystis lapponica]
MPEADVLCALKRLVVKVQNTHVRRYNEPLRGHLQLFPRTFAAGPSTENRVTCTAQRRGYEDTLEPIPDTFRPDESDEARSQGQAWQHLLKPLHDGEVVVQVRGAEMFLAAGYHGMRINFGAEASLLSLKRRDLDELLSQDVPGPDTSNAKAQELRSFLVLNRFVVPRSKQAARERTLNIFAALVCEHAAFAVVDLARAATVEIISLARHWEQRDVQPGSELWSALWSDNRGPDWIYETEAARRPSCGGASRSSTSRTAARPIFAPIVKGRPGLVHGHVGLTHIPGARGGDPERGQPLQYNYKSNKNYMARYVRVYRKSSVHVPAELYNRLLRSGMLDRQHVSGEPYSEEQLHASGLTFAQDGHKKDCTVVVYRQGKFKIYTVIRARPPADWLFQSDALPELAEDAPHAGYTGAMLGPGQSRQHVQNQLDPALAGRPGRRKKLPSSGPGRPAKQPGIAQVRALGRVGAQRQAKAGAQLAAERLQDARAGESSRAAAARGPEERGADEAFYSGDSDVFAPDAAETAGGQQSLRPVRAVGLRRDRGAAMRSLAENAGQRITRSRAACVGAHEPLSRSGRVEEHAAQAITADQLPDAAHVCRTAGSVYAPELAESDRPTKRSKSLDSAV